MNIIQKKMSRRNFIMAAAATGTVAAFSATLNPSLRALAKTNNPLSNGSGEWKPTTCQGCTSWCSAQVYVVEGRAIKVRGNPNSKVNGIASCPRAHMGL